VIARASSISKLFQGQGYAYSETSGFPNRTRATLPSIYRIIYIMGNKLAMDAKRAPKPAPVITPNMLAAGVSALRESAHLEDDPATSNRLLVRQIFEAMWHASPYQTDLWISLFKPAPQFFH